MSERERDRERKRERGRERDKEREKVATATSVSVPFHNISNCLTQRNSRSQTRAFKKNQLLQQRRAAAMATAADAQESEGPERAEGAEGGGQSTVKPKEKIPLWGGYIPSKDEAVLSGGAPPPRLRPQAL